MPFVPSSAIVRPDRPQPSDGPEPGVLETIGAGFRTAEDEVSTVIEKRRFRAYQDLETALVEAGVPQEDLREKPIGAFGLPFLQPGVQSRVPDLDAIWSAAVAMRKRNPKMFPALPATKEEFEEAALRRGEGRTQDQDVLARGSGVAGFIGGIGGEFTDPTNVLLTLVGGGGKTIAQAALREGLLNAGIETLQTPQRAKNKEALGETLTAGEAGLNIVAAGIGGAVLGGLGKGVYDNWGAIKGAPKAAQEKLWGAILEKNPGLAERVGSKMDWDALDDHLPDIAESIIGADNLSQGERSAIHVLRREGEIDAANPFVANGAGTAAHRQMMQDAMERILAANPAAPVPAGSRALPVRSSVAGSTSIGSGIVPGTGRDVLKSRIGRVESGGRVNAKNPNSSATGLYQFIGSTWLKMYKSRYGTGGLSDAQILAKRGDARIQNVLMDDLIEINARALARAGISETAGNLYLAHFAGSGGATKLHRADPQASAASVLGQDVVNANPFLKGMTAADVIAWAHGKMGQAVSGGGSVRVRDDLEGGDELTRALQQEIDRLENERLQIEREMESTRSPLTDAVAKALDDDVEPVILDRPDLDGADGPAIGDDIPPMVVPDIEGDSAVGAARSGLTPEQEIVRTQVADIVANGTQSLNNLKKLARELGTTAEEVRAALDSMVNTGAGRQIRKKPGQGKKPETFVNKGAGLRKNAKGQFFRLPRNLTPPSTDDVLSFIASVGGLSDRGGAFGLKRLSAKEKKGLTGSQIRNTEYKRSRVASRDMQLFIPRLGPLLRHNGRSLDALGELLWEAGFFPPFKDRPDEDQVAELIEKAFNQWPKRLYPDDDMRNYEIDNNFDPDDDVLPDYVQFEIEDRNYWNSLAYDLFGDDLDDADYAMVRAIEADGLAFPSGIREIDQQAMLLEMVNRKAQEDIYDLWEQARDDVYENLLDQWAMDAEEIATGFGSAGQGIAGRAGDAGPARAGGQDGEAAARGAAQDDLEETGPFDPEQDFADFDDPVGAGTQAAADSLEHDLRATVGDGNPLDLGPQVDPAAYGKGIEQARLGAEAPIRAQVDQESTIGSPLFDAVDQGKMEFRLNTDEEPISAPDFLKALDEEEAMIKNIKDCL